MDSLIEETINRLIKDKSKLEELSRSKDFISQELHLNSKTVINHLIKLFLWNKISNENINHWITEITASLYHTYRIKGTNKFPTYKQLQNWFLIDDLEILSKSLNRLVKKASVEEKLDIPQYDNNILYKYIATYLDWICQELAKNGLIEDIDMENKLKDLINSYNQESK